MAQSTHAQKKRTSPGRVFRGVIFLLFALAAISLAAFVYIFYISKQNSLPWMLNAVLLSIIALVFIVVGIVLFVPVSSESKRSGMNYCPGCGIKLQKKYNIEIPCPNPKCDKMLGPDDWASKHCFSCGTEILQVVGQVTGQFPVIQKSSFPPKQPGTS